MVEGECRHHVGMIHGDVEDSDLVLRDFTLEEQRVRLAQGQLLDANFDGYLRVVGWTEE